MPLMFPIHTVPPMFPLYPSFSHTTPLLTTAFIHTLTYNPSHPSYCYISLLHLTYFIFGLLSIHIPIFESSLKFRRFVYSVISNNLLVKISNRLIYMYMYTINAIHQATLDKSPIHVLSYYATTLYLSLHLPVLFLHLMYLFNPTHTICLAMFYTVLIFRFTCMIYSVIKLPQTTLKADEYFLQYKVLEKSIVAWLSFTLFLLSFLICKYLG